MKNKLPLAIFLMGPTNTGKSKLAISLYKRLPIKIISVDSALIYKEMNIGTAKPSKKQLSITPHYLINIIDPSENYSVIKFRNDAIKKMIQITKSGYIPLLVGGTMFYFKILLEGLPLLPSSNLQIRDLIKNYMKLYNSIKLHDLLKNIDLHSAKRIHPNDSQRIIRALEIFFCLKNKNCINLKQTKINPLKYQIKQFAINPISKIKFNKLIEDRFYNMLKIGFEEEVRTLFSKGNLNKEMSSMKCIGYRQMLSYILNEISYEDMIYKTINATKQLAKRQMTWLRKWNNLIWLDDNNFTISLNIIFNNIIKYKLNV